MMQRSTKPAFTYFHLRTCWSSILPRASVPFSDIFPVLPFLKSPH